jgi:uncharacterized membrane protein YhaH (DUF805 family)
MTARPFNSLRNTLGFSFQPRGRADRGEAWTYLLAATLCATLLSGMVSALTATPLADWLSLGVVVACAIPAPALAARRFHDFNGSGWWSLALAPGALRLLILEILQRGFGRSAQEMAEDVFHWIDWAIFPTFGLAYLALLAWPGSSGANRFGPPVTGRGDERPAPR